MQSTQRRNPGQAPPVGAAPSSYMSTAATVYNPVPIDAAAVILVTAGYDHTIRFWDALSGVCIRTIQHPDSVLFDPVRER